MKCADRRSEGRGRGGATPWIIALTAIMWWSAPSHGQNICWDNDIVPNGFNGRATSPPVFPSLRVVSEFTPPAEGQELVALRTMNIEDADWEANLPVLVYLYEDGGECPGGLLVSFETSDVTRTSQGQQLFDREVYEYWIAFDPVGLAAGTYHIGASWPQAGGAGTSYWLTSDGRDGVDRTDCFSLDSGNDWLNMGEFWHMAFELYCSGNPPTTGACCLDGGVCRVLSPGVCAAREGVYRGDGVTCEDADCPAELTGACCYPDGSCAVVTGAACLEAGGAYQGNGVPCEESDCPPTPTGACCFPDGSCELLTGDFCANAGGTYEGDDVSCKDVSCPVDSGPCWDNDLVPNGGVGFFKWAADFLVPRSGLEVVGLRQTNGEEHDFVPTLPVEVYLYADGGVCPGELIVKFETAEVTRTFLEQQVDGLDVYEYVIRFDSVVLEQGRYYIGSIWPHAEGPGRTAWLTSDGGGGADRNDCFASDGDERWLSWPDRHMAFELICQGPPLGLGACCFSDERACLVLSETLCEELGGTYLGHDRSCADTNCPCPADLDGDADVDFDDLVILLAAWGPCEECPADFDENGVVDFDDLLVVLDDWGPCDDT